MQIIMGRATNICSTFHTPPPRVVSSVEGSTQCTRILANTRNLHFNCEEREGREGKEKRGGSARYSSPSGEEGSHPPPPLPSLSFTRRYEYYASLVYRGEKDASKDVRNYVCSYIISNYVQRNSK